MLTVRVFSFRVRNSDQKKDFMEEREPSLPTGRLIVANTLSLKNDYKCSWLVVFTKLAYYEQCVALILRIGIRNSKADYKLAGSRQMRGRER